MMRTARRLVGALAVAHGAAALVEGFVDVLVNVDVRVPAELLAGVIGAAAGSGGGGDDSGYDACYTIGSVINSCDAAGMLEPTVPAVSAGGCLCCIDNAAISTEYAACASYAAQVDGGPEYRSAYRVATQVFSVCAAVGAGVCMAGTAAIPTPTPTRGATARTSLPPACRSMMTIYNSCSEELSFRTASARDIASCFCHDESGDYNTAFEDYASSCASFARTAAPNDYTIITRLATFCDAFPPVTATAPLVFSTVSTRTDGQFALPSSTSSAPSASSPTSTSAGEPVGSNETTSTSTGLAAAGPLPGFLVWAANWATFFMSFFLLI